MINIVSLFVISLIFLIAIAVFLFSTHNAEALIRTGGIAILAGITAFIVSALFTYKTEKISKSIPVSVSYYTETLIPIDPIQKYAVKKMKAGFNFFESPPSSAGSKLYGTNPKFAEEEVEKLKKYISENVDELERKSPKSDHLYNGLNSLGSELYKKYIVYYILDRMTQDFNQSWSFTKINYESPIGKSTERKDNFDVKSKIIKRDKLAELFPEITIFALEDPFDVHENFNDKLVLPPKTTIKQEGASHSYSIFLENPFAKVEIKISSKAGIVGLGKFTYLIMDNAIDAQRKFWTSDYNISVEAEFSFLKSQYKEMPLYRAWVENIVYLFEEDLSYRLYWEQVKDWRLLSADSPETVKKE